MQSSKRHEKGRFPALAYSRGSTDVCNPISVGRELLAGGSNSWQTYQTTVSNIASRTGYNFSNYPQ